MAYFWKWRWGRGGEGPSNFASSTVYSNTFSLKYSMCQGTMFQASVSWTHQRQSPPFYFLNKESLLHLTLMWPAPVFPATATNHLVEQIIQKLSVSILYTSLYIYRSNTQTYASKILKNMWKIQKCIEWKGKIFFLPHPPPQPTLPPLLLFL